MNQMIRIWDLPTRIFHWALVACVAGLVFTAEFAYMEWHFRLGYAVLALLLFRLVWGFVGGRWSRFSSFTYPPATLWRYLKGQSTPEQLAGHTPTGALSVFTLLLLLLAQVLSGTLSDDEAGASGPFTAWVSSAVVEKATWYHSEVGKAILIVLVILHVAAIAYYRWRKGSNLLMPMLTGDKALPSALPPARDDKRTRLRALVVLMMVVGLVLALLKLSPTA